MVNYKAIGRRISFYRKKKGLTQAVLAEILNISDSFVSQVECGKKEVSLSRLYEIADALGINVALLVSDGNISNGNDIYSEIQMLINKWSPEQRELLIEMIFCADRIMKSK